MTEQNRKFQGVWIPAETWLDKRLSITEKVMLVEINSLESKDRGCYATNAHFAEFFDISGSRVSQIISGLAEKELISVVYIRDGKQVVERQIRMADPFRKLKPPPLENAANPFRKLSEPPLENAKGSSTQSSNTLSKEASPKISFGENGEWSGISDGIWRSWNASYPALNLDRELAKAGAWLLANPKNKKSNYARFLTNWLARAQDSAPRAPEKRIFAENDRCRGLVL